MTLRGRPFTDHANTMRKCPDCGREMTVVEEGSWTTPNKCRCNHCQKTFERESTLQFAAAMGKWWLKAVKLITGTNP